MGQEWPPDKGDLTWELEEKNEQGTSQVGREESRVWKFWGRKEGGVL